MDYSCSLLKVGLHLLDSSLIFSKCYFFKRNDMILYTLATQSIFRQGEKEKKRFCIHKTFADNGSEFNQNTQDGLSQCSSKTNKVVVNIPCMVQRLL